ncbi:unnamed protein product [Phyllotreta striolata]|uniref:Uncharacterized protein n=1 Tax=Phyllotreta striolata TaxID=444603 RepID=A0A9N9TRH9_PHYSR|nr:unnamed protein product [Phyllotreta striolata]
MGFSRISPAISIFKTTTMNQLSVAVFFVAVAAASAGGLLGAGIIGDKGALEGALGGQWIPDTVEDGAHGAAIVGHGSARGALEGALGGQWIPDVPVAHGPIAAPVIAGPLAAPLAGPLVGPLGLGLGLGHGLGLGNGLGLGHGLGVGIVGHGVSRGSLEGALGGQWIPDVHGH